MVRFCPFSSSMLLIRRLGRTHRRPNAISGTGKSSRTHRQGRNRSTPPNKNPAGSKTASSKTGYNPRIKQDEKQLLFAGPQKTPLRPPPMPRLRFFRLRLAISAASKVGNSDPNSSAVEPVEDFINRRSRFALNQSMTVLNSCSRDEYPELSLIKAITQQVLRSLRPWEMAFRITRSVPDHFCDIRFL